MDTIDLHNRQHENSDENIMHIHIRVPLQESSSSSSQSTGTAEMRPVPQAIPILTHPSLYFYDENQITNPSYEYKIPSAPMTFIKLHKDHNSNPSAVSFTWYMSRNKSLDHIFAYQLFVHEEPIFKTTTQELWKYNWTTPASRLPMTCTMTDFTIGMKYNFSVRAADIFNRFGVFSKPKSFVYI